MGRSVTTTGASCRFPGCDRPRAAWSGIGQPPTYCDNPAHNKHTGYRARKSATIAAERQELQRLRALLTTAQADVA